MFFISTFHLNPVKATIHNTSGEKLYSINIDKNQNLITVADAAVLSHLFITIVHGF